MEEIKSALARVLAETPSSKVLFRRNCLKEYLQVVVLDFIYSHPTYGKLVFYGGSCLAQLHGLPRLSEDLDFVDDDHTVALKELSDDLVAYFNGKTDVHVAGTVQKFRVYLKFSILKELKLAHPSESDFLMLKVEVFKDDGRLRDCPREVIPLFKRNRSIVINTFDLPTLMATKIRAVLHRRWERTDKAGNVIAAVKGRDYFDLMWYLRKGIVPNLACLKEIGTIAALKGELLPAIERADPTSVKADLDALIADDHFVDEISRNLREILKREIARLPDNP